MGLVGMAVMRSTSFALSTPMPVAFSVGRLGGGWGDAYSVCPMVARTLARRFGRSSRRPLVLR